MEYFSSLFQNIKDKLTNPFFGTLIIVLIVHHPQFWYSIFNFDEGVDLRQKINYLSELGKREFSPDQLASDFLFSLAVVVIGYFIVVSTRALSMWIEFWLMPEITKKIVNKKLVFRTDYDEVVKERDDYSEKYEEQRKSVRSMSKDYDEQSQQLNTRNSQLNDLQDKLTHTEASLSREKSENSRIQRNLNNSKDAIAKYEGNNEALKTTNNLLHSKINGFKEMFFQDENKEFFDSLTKFPPSIREVAHDLHVSNNWRTFLDVGRFFKDGGGIDPNKLNELDKFGLILRDDDSHEILSPIGEILWGFRELFNQSLFDNPLQD